MTEIKKIYFVHEGRAYYPSVDGISAYYGGRYTYEEITFAEARLRTDVHRAICWHFMGFYPERLHAALTIHDYKSISVEPFGAVKDFLKHRLNARPDIRIVTPHMHDEKCFMDDVPAVVQDMPVPNYIMQFRPQVMPPSRYDFSYIGVMSRERRTHLMIDSFLRRYGSSKTFLLIGKPEEYLVKRYSQTRNIIFIGQKPQQEAYALMLQARVSVCYFPNHRPHVYQTPTKLLDAAGLGLRILANEQPMNRARSSAYGIHVRWCKGDDMFAGLPDALDWPDNRNVDPTPFLWTTVMHQSGIDTLIERALLAKNISYRQAA